ncbi:MAG TPA: UvrD-helicase domain-containing protein [Solirubrobacteraceae bacterium]|jgi:exodeoxyribonuclease V beta subunit|nr:UvrD-helicase domain-containing protein [Solirubrobacteraceae bacterium]
MSDAPDATPFDIGEPLPPGVTVLEASAGTGKTYTIAALATRYVAEGLPLESLLLVSFTRLATGELRDRVRERLAAAHRALDGATDGTAVDLGDLLVRQLATGRPEDVARRRERLARALAEFDAATITTTHGFCQEVLGGLGVAGDVDLEYSFVDDPGDLIEEVVGDLYVRGFLDHAAAFSPAQARAIATLAVTNPAAPIAPVSAELRVARVRVLLAERVRQEVERRKRAAAVLTFDDLLTRLQAALEGPEGSVIAERLRSRYRVALIDEFQDTDPSQWEIVRRAFGGPDGTLVLIGDPKQAVYAFRGADVYAYLAAARSAVVRRTLATNWRSDEGLVAAYDALFEGVRLGHPEIAYRQVRAAPGNHAPRLIGAPADAPLSIRVFCRELPSIETTQKGYATVRSARDHVARDLSAEAVALLSSGARIEDRAQDGTVLVQSGIQPHDLAVLVRTNFEARLVKQALDDARVPAVINGAGSVFSTETARDWLRLLEALERPSAAARARSVALTPFLGWSPERVASAGDEEWEALHQRLHRWASVLRGSGVAALTETIMVTEGVPARMLGRAGGERDLTDLRHTAELLHAFAVQAQLGTTALASWLRRRIGEAERDAGVEDRARRLESDAAAVQVLTIHASKGLEFPVVFCPYLWQARSFRNDPEPVTFHDAADEDQRTIDVALEGQDYSRHRQQDRVEQRGEELRLAYVALTRARHQAVVWWVGAWQSKDSALGRLVFDRDDRGNVASEGSPPPDDDEALQCFRALAARAPGRIAVVTPTDPAPARWMPPAPETLPLDAASLDRGFDGRWRRTSYTGITAGVPEQLVASEIEEAAGADDLQADGPAGVVAGDDDADREAELSAVPAPLGEMPVGARVGTLVHAVLEAADFTAADLDAELRTRVAEALRRRRVDVGDPGELAAGLRTAIETPLGPLAGGVRLRDLRSCDRLNELAFELPLVGGDTPTSELTLDAIAVELDLGLPAGDRLRGYARRLSDPSLRRVLCGYLTGTIDLVARVADSGSGSRFAVVDYKTNRLAQHGELLTAWHHRPSALAAEMVRAHYVLQALLYSVALHRYLRWRLAGYDPEENLGGVLYLFLRGMVGPGTPVLEGSPCGVFAWRPAPSLVVALSDLFDRGSPR